jgi:hypothetical protein
MDMWGNTSRHYAAEINNYFCNSSNRKARQVEEHEHVIESPLEKRTPYRIKSYLDLIVGANILKFIYGIYE